MKTLSVTIISGFPGSGKTSVLQHLQKSLPEMAVAVIANSGSFEELLRDVAELTESGRFDYLLLESSGASGPMELAEMFSSTDESGDSPVSMASIDTMVTVVDAQNISLATFRVSKSFEIEAVGYEITEDDRDIARVLD
jgi:G3E family GTPase